MRRRWRKCWHEVGCSLFIRAIRLKHCYEATILLCFTGYSYRTDSRLDYCHCLSTVPNDILIDVPSGQFYLPLITGKLHRHGVPLPRQQRHVVI